MAKIDMHVHTAFSERPSEWFLQRIGAKESYSRPEQAYAAAMKRGMDFVTITDHNRIDGALLLKELHPGKVMVGVESTTYFPEDRCKVHLLIYGIDEREFTIVQKLRHSIYELRDYLNSENIAHSVAHATYSINNKLTSSHLEKLILLFNVFEGINGARGFYLNNSWMEILQHLTPAHIEALKVRHSIEPSGSEPWRKAFTAGSDDHSGLFIGTTFTLTDASSVEEITDNLRNKRITPQGRHNDYKSLAFGIYKIALDFTQAKNGKSPGSLLFSISEQLFRPQQQDYQDCNIAKGIKPLARLKNNRISDLIRLTVEEVKKIDPELIEERFEVIYDKASDIADEFFKRIIETLASDLETGDISNIIINISSSIPGLFLSLPFLSALGHMNENREIITETMDRLGTPLKDRRRKILWFTDTINDLNGVAETLKDFAWMSHRNGRTVHLVAALPEKDKGMALPPNIIFVPTFFSLVLPEYENLSVHFPSLLKAIELIAKEEPTEIFISTPGPIGMLGLMAAKLLKIRCTGIYHTDFTRQLEHIVQDSSLPDLVERSMRWFYSMMDVVKVPTAEYTKMLVDRGFEPWKIKIIPKAVDPDLFKPDKGTGPEIFARWGINDGITLLYAGRISKDKNLDLLCRVYLELSKERPDINLLIVGEGPYLEEMRHALSPHPRIHFTGRIPREELPPIYANSHIFVFPSTTDTFGMVVLEAQACGLPAIVSDVGGPQEIISDGRTGFVSRRDDQHDLLEKIQTMLTIIENDPRAYARMKRRARLHSTSRYCNESLLEQLVGSGVYDGIDSRKPSGDKKRFGKKKLAPGDLPARNIAG
ncbi:MAG TPA: glycosyltransferase [Desulfomonilia bacterium]|nr:glycosyltransferase [Desulfomonilia bacterium]